VQRSGTDGLGPRVVSGGGWNPGDGSVNLCRPAHWLPPTSMLLITKGSRLTKFAEKTAGGMKSMMVAPEGEQIYICMMFSEIKISY
jgi:hypothetical protein